jgi:hypothetical protein
MRWRRHPAKNSEAQANATTLPAEQAQDRLDVAREGAILNYFAIHDGRTLNACVDVASEARVLILTGPQILRLDPSEINGHWRTWVFDLLDLELQAGSYELRGLDEQDNDVALVAPNESVGRKGDPARDGKVADLHEGQASAVLADSVPTVVIEGLSDEIQLSSLNLLGPDKYSLVMTNVKDRRTIVASLRGKDLDVEIGAVDGLEGMVNVTLLRNDDDVKETIWDIVVTSEYGGRRALSGPAVDYNRPDQATSFGDLVTIGDGWKYRWKPYISRAGTLAIRVTSETMPGVQ